MPLPHAVNFDLKGETTCGSVMVAAFHNSDTMWNKCAGKNRKNGKKRSYY